MTLAVDVRDAFRIFASPGGGTAALQGLSLQVEPGEIVVALGPSGSGKTTLLRAVAGLESLSAGSARVLGSELGQLDGRATAAFRAERLGLLDQHYARSLSPDLTCRETVALQLRLLGRHARSSRQAADELLERVGLRARGGARPAELSGGEQQRVAVCAALAHRPELLLADEPAGELDSETASTVYRLLGELVRERGGSALIVSHDPGAAAIADRQVWIRDGRVVQEARRGDPRSLVVSHGWIRLPGAVPETRTVTPVAAAELLADPARRPPAGRSPRRQSPRRASRRPSCARSPSATAPAPCSTTSRPPSCPGRLTAIVGRSGSGKTTLLHLIAGLERPSAGVVRVAGTPLGDLTRSELATLRRRHVALVTQEPGLVPYLSALENVDLGLDPARRSGRRSARCPLLRRARGAPAPSGRAPLRRRTPARRDRSRARRRRRPHPARRADRTPGRGERELDLHSPRPAHPGTRRHHPLRHPRSAADRARRRHPRARDGR